MTAGSTFEPVPNSAGTEPPRSKAPANSCDAHLHIIDPRFSAADAAAKPLRQMTVTDYRALQRRIGTTRAVIVQPKVYGTDNECTLDAVAQLGANGRGIAVVHPEVGDAELRRLDAGGVRRLRFSLANPNGTCTTL